MNDVPVLIADDRAENLLALEAALEGLGLRVVRAASGRDAAELGCASRFAVALLDVRMPDLNGLEVARRMRGSAPGHGTPIVLVTAADFDASTERRAYALGGVVDFVSKPIDVDVLRAKVAVFSELWRKREQGEVDASLEVERISREERERMYEVFAQLPIGIAVYHGPDHVIEFVNPAFSAMYEGRRLVGRQVRDALAPHPGARGMSTLDEAYRTGRTITVAEYPATLPGDHATEQRYFDWTIQPLRDAAGEVEGVISIAQDVTTQTLLRRASETARTRAELSDAEQSVALARVLRLHRVTEALTSAATVAEVSDVMVRHGVDAMASDTCALYLARDDGALELVGAHGLPAEILAHITVLAPVGSGPSAFGAAPIWVETEQKYHELYPEIANRPAPGPRVKAFWSLPLVTHGRSIGMLAMGFHTERSFADDQRDFVVTFARQCALALERAKVHDEQWTASQRLALIAKVSRVVSSTINYEETLKNIARALIPDVGEWCAVDLATSTPGETRLMALEHADPKKVALGYRLRELYPSDPAEPGGRHEVLRTGVTRCYGTIPDALLTSLARSDEHLQILRDLGMKSAAVIAMKLDAKVVGTISLVSTDARRSYTAADVPFLEELGRRAAVAVEHARLHRDAEQAVALRDDFLMIAAHELRTPVTALSLQVQRFLRRPPDVDGAMEQVRRIGVQAQRMSALIERLLDMSRIASGRMNIATEDVDLGEVVQVVVASLEEPARSAGCTVTLAIEPDVRGLWSREGLDEIVTNLVSNAIKYGAGKPIHVAVDATADGASLRVCDEGIGIAPSDQRRIFERFERAVRTENFGGFGVGLWICRQLVESMSGSIMVESAPGAGATFTVVLPARNSAVG